jgi:hypothetical protein
MEPPVSLRKSNLLIIFSAVLIVIINVSLFFAMQRFQTRRPDFAGLYQAGRLIRQQRFPAVQEHFPAMKGPDFEMQASEGGAPADTMHPPYEQAIFVALAFLPYRVAYPFWWACNLGLAGITAWLLWKELPNLRSAFPYLLILIATFFPVLVALVQGQTSILLLTLLTLSYVLLRKQRDFRAGFALSLGMFKFVLVTPIALLLILERRWRSLAGFAAGCFALFLDAASLVGIKGIAAYVSLVAGYGRSAPEKAGTEIIMPNLRGLMHVFAGFAPESILKTITILLTLALLLWVDSGITRFADLKSRFSSQILLSVLISYHLYPHDATILILPIAIMLNQAMDAGAERKFRIAVFICAGLIYLLSLFAPLQVGMPVVGIASLLLLFLQKRVPEPHSVWMTAQ